MVAILDIMASFIIGGIILIMSTKLSAVMSDNGQQTNVSLATQGNAVVLSKMLENDVSKTGYKNTKSSHVITSDSTKVKFYGDIDDNGTLDSITYYSGPLTSPYVSLNPRHKLLYRTLNTKTTTMNLGVTKFNLIYFDASGARTTTPSNVRSMKIMTELESLIPIADTVYAVVHWEQYIKPKVFQYTFN